MRAIPPRLSPRAVPVARRAASARLWLRMLALGLAFGAAARLPAAQDRIPASQGGTTQAEPSSADLTRLAVRIAGGNDLPTRVEAAVLILQSYSGEGVKALLDILESENYETAKLAICQAITQTQADNPAFIPPLISLAKHKESALREAALTALAGFNDPEVTALRRELELQLLEKRFVTLCKRNYELQPTDAERVAQLDRMLKAALSLERVTALEIIHENMSAGARPAPELLRQVRQMLGDRDERVRARLIMILRDLRQPQDAPLVRTQLDREYSVLVREEIYKALGYLGDPASIPACVGGLEELRETVAAQAASALGRLAAKSASGTPADLELVVNALLQRARRPMEHPLLREQVIEAMAQIADPRFLVVLREYAGPSERLPAIRQAAIVGIGQVGNPAEVSRVIERLENDPDPGVREMAADAMGKLGTKPEHLESLRARLDPKIEASPMVQNRAWEAYKGLFIKVLSPESQEKSLATWGGTDPVSMGRRIDLLSALEKQMSKAAADRQRLAAIREQMGDACFSAGRFGDAAGAFASVLDSLAAGSGEVAQRIAQKLIDAHLRTPAPEKAISMITETKHAPFRDMLIDHLLQYAVQAGASNPAAATALLDRLSELVPDQFGPSWAPRFQQLRRSLPPASQPATRPEGRRT